MDFELTDTCPFCGKKILTLTGMVYAQNNPGDPKTAGIPEACDCQESIENEKRLAAQEDARHRAAEKEQALRNLKASGLPRKYAEENGLASWDTTGDPNRAIAMQIGCAIGASLRSGKHNGRGIFLSGGIGVGKTHFAAALIRDLLLRGIRCYWRYCGNILREIRSSYGKSGSQEEEIIALYTRINVLAIDDLGKERPTEWSLEQLFNIINARYEEGRTTIITSNYTLDTLTARLTPAAAADNTTAAAIVDRINATCYSIPISGTSRRTALSIK